MFQIFSEMPFVLTICLSHIDAFTAYLSPGQTSLQGLRAALQGARSSPQIPSHRGGSDMCRLRFGFWSFCLSHLHIIDKIHKIDIQIFYISLIHEASDLMRWAAFCPKIVWIVCLLQLGPPTGSTALSRLKKWLKPLDNNHSISLPL